MRGPAKSAIGLLCTTLLAGCVTTDGDRSSGTYAVPPNYRQLVARKVIEGTAHIGPIRSASISQPVERFAGLLGGGSRPIVCAGTTNDGRLISQDTRWLFMFENGQIASAVANPGAIYCAGVVEGPFPEVAKSR
jgi:hypothetical protein